MSVTALAMLIRRSRVLCRARSTLTDAELLRRFTQDRDAAAFEEVLERHAALVWGVCRRILSDEADCEDAFQATFFALVRQADAVEVRSSLAAWLYTVAVRVARKAQARRRQQRPLSLVPGCAMRGNVTDDVGSRELFRLVDEEIERLPVALRLPLLLCCLQGRTRDEAAEALGCSVASVKSRLERGRNLLRRRLQSRGLGLPAAFLALELTGGSIRAALWDKTMQAVLSTPAPAAAALAEIGVSGVTMGKCKLLLVALLLAAGTAGAVSWLPGAKPTDPPAAAAPKEATTAKAAPVRVDRHGDPLPDGAVARLGTVRWRHGYGIGKLVYSPNGEKIAAAGFGPAVTLSDVASGKLLHRFPHQSQPNSGVAFAPDGTMLATADTHVCHLWDLATGKELRQLQGGQEAVHSIAFAPDGKIVAGADLGGTLHLWQTATGDKVRRNECKQEVLWAVEFSPDGQRLATGGTDGSICLWDSHTGIELHRLRAHQRGVTKIGFSPDGKRMLSSGFGLGETIREWDTATGRALRTFGAKRRGRLPIALSVDGTMLASGEFDGQIRLWDMVSGEEKRHWRAGPTPLWALAFSPDGKTLASGADMDVSIHFWDVATGREQHPSQEHVGPVHVLRYSPDGKTLVSASTDKRMLWWDLTEQLPRRQLAWSAKGEDRLIALSANGNVLADAHILSPRTEEDRPIQLWDVRTGKPGLKLDDNRKQRFAIAFSPDGRLLASGSEDSCVTLWDVHDGKEVRQIKGPAFSVRSLCFSPDGTALAVGLWNDNEALDVHTLTVCDVASGKERSSFDVRDTLTGLAFSPDGKVLAGGNGYRQDAFVRLWDVRTGAELCRHEGHRGSCGAIAFSPDGKLVASGTGSLAWPDSSVHVWEAATGRLIRRFEGHHGDVGSVAFSPDGLSLASGGGDSAILLWDITGLRADGRWPTNQLTQRQLDACWAALAGADAAQAYDAVWALAAAPEQAVSFLKKHLPPLPRPDEKTVAQLVADLDSNDFRTRENATEELRTFGDSAADPLRQVLVGKPSPEERRRLQPLLRQARDWTAERLRDHRAIQALEHIGTRSARKVLQALAEGAPGARRTEEAKDVLRWLGQR
jgi:RNA polymerase sigma factor (sigma-70 family)